MKTLSLLVLCSGLVCAQVFSASTGTAIASSATPAFSLSAISSTSPIIFTISPTVNVTGPTITNKSAGARFTIVITSDGTHTWSWNGIVADNICPVYTDAAAKTYAAMVIDPDGSTVHGESCWFNLAGAVAYGQTVSAPSSNPSSGNMLCNLTVAGLDCLGSAGTHYVMTAAGWSQIYSSSALSNSSATSTVTLATSPPAGDYVTYYSLDLHTGCTTGTGLLDLQFGWTANASRTITTGNWFLTSTQAASVPFSGSLPMHVVSGNVTFTPQVTSCATGTATWDGFIYLVRVN